MSWDPERIQKEWESYLKDRTITLEFYHEMTRGSFSTAQPYKVVLAAEGVHPVTPKIRQIEVR